MKTQLFRSHSEMIIGTYIVLKNHTVMDAEVEGQYISGGRYENVQFKNVIFNGVDIQATVFINCSFINCHFVGCTFSSALFKNCHFLNSAIAACNLSLTKIYNCTFEAESMKDICDTLIPKFSYGQGMAISSSHSLAA